MKTLNKYFHREQGTTFILLDLGRPFHFVLIIHHHCTSLQSFPAIGVSFLLSCPLSCSPDWCDPPPGLNGVRLEVHWTAGYWPQQDIPTTQFSSLFPLPTPPHPNKCALMLTLSLQVNDPNCKVPKGKCYFRMSATWQQWLFY